MPQTPVKSDRDTLPSAPRWVKVFGIIALVFALLLIIALVTGLGGPHGPGRHIPPSDSSGYYMPTLEQSGQQL